jgi:predicted transcriptional regulator
VIVRIATEDQFEVPQERYEELNDLDNAVVAAVEQGDEETYAKAFAQLIEFIHANGTKVADDDLRESDVIVPPSDTSLEEAKADFSGEGIIPESVLPGSS